MIQIRSNPKKIKVQVGDDIYESLVHAARVLGVTPPTIKKRMLDGKLLNGAKVSKISIVRPEKGPMKKNAKK
jgi:hypothetical protein